MSTEKNIDALTQANKVFELANNLAEINDTLNTQRTFAKKEEIERHQKVLKTLDEKMKPLFEACKPFENLQLALLSGEKAQEALRENTKRQEQTAKLKAYQERVIKRLEKRHDHKSQKIVSNFQNQKCELNKTFYSPEKSDMTNLNREDIKNFWELTLADETCMDRLLENPKAAALAFNNTSSDARPEVLTNNQEELRVLIQQRLIQIGHPFDIYGCQTARSGLKDQLEVFVDYFGYRNSNKQRKTPKTPHGRQANALIHKKISETGLSLLAQYSEDMKDSDIAFYMQRTAIETYIHEAQNPAGADKKVLNEVSDAHIITCTGKHSPTGGNVSLAMFVNVANRFAAGKTDTATSEAFQEFFGPKSNWGQMAPDIIKYGQNKDKKSKYLTEKIFPDAINLMNAIHVQYSYKRLTEQMASDSEHKVKSMNARMLRKDLNKALKEAKGTNWKDFHRQGLISDELMGHLALRNHLGKKSRIAAILRNYKAPKIPEVATLAGQITHLDI